MTGQNVCACGCQTPIPQGSTWKRGHHVRGRGGYNDTLQPLPSPADVDNGDLDGEDIGDIDLEDLEEDTTSSTEPLEDTGRSSEPPRPDPQPAHASRDWKRSGGGRGTKKTRITAAVRGDIEGKLGIMLELPARVWQARDPICGGQFVDQLPEIRPAAVDLICQSPDLVEWFTGTGGAFMMWFNLAAACWPVVTVVMAHHIFHSIETPQEDRDMSRYAA